ncbi:Dos2-interacting transcription regulator of RNA-Pol-II-domain-containing protein [Suillus bovinus]|uniref:Dos2-interacting transcription regulator of RNA-Pol-II-domain-containing protein n=1 Tax=Suillus bovinus TaxID=48563 RepID=UPI001B880124|nr:Dos2-interacting transcription regulator of RNA-Pol-II-domain-containing protein [Suillus bovinus]KAG2150264.1 Dos2-interacting transcription regulator of RNA-Pol-II-domain-containing protein [Suillus bovinus]
MASEKDSEVDESVAGISSGQLTLLDIIKALGEFLTSEEDRLRTKGVKFLSSVLGRCPHEKLNRQAIRVLTTFYCSKLEDFETIIPALNGISYLVKFPNIQSAEVKDILNAIFANIKMKALVQSTRFFVFSIVDSLIAIHRDTLKEMGSTFLAGYVNLAVGEKDPRNLMLAFAIARVMLVEFDILAHIEDFFDITFCYFPITFRPPPDDPYGISADDLKQSLRLCLCATPAFGPLGIPIFLEKLTAGSPTTKRDTLQAMDICLPVYGPAVSREFGKKIWSSLKLEIFQPTDPDTEHSALNTLQVLVRTMHADKSSDAVSEDSITGLARDMCSECIQALKEPEKSQARPAMKVICAFARANGSLSSFAVSQAAELLIRNFHDPDEVSNRASVVVLLTELIEACRDDATQSSHPTSSPLTASKDALLGLLIVSLKSPATCLPALHGLITLVRTPNLVADDELGYIVLEVSELLRKEPDEARGFSTDTLALLSAIAGIAPHHLSSQTLPILFSFLPDVTPSRDATEQRASYWRALSSLSALCVQPQLFETLVIRLIAKLDLLCAILPTSTIDQESTAAYAHAILTALANTLDVKVSSKDVDVPKYAEQLLPHIFRLYLDAALASSEVVAVAADPRLLQVGARIIRLVSQTLNVARQEKLVASVFAAYTQGDVKQITGGLLNSSTPFAPLHLNASSRQRNSFTLFSSTIVSLRKEVRMPVDDLSNFLSELIAWSDDPSSTVFQREAASHVLASTVNKHVEDISGFLSHQLESYSSSVLKNPSIPAQARKHAINTWISVTRALLVRSHPSGNIFFDHLFELLDDNMVGWDAARAIGLLASEDAVLTKRNNAVLKVLHVQKYFNVVMPRLLEGAKGMSGSQRETAYLVALAYLINAVPKAVYVTQMPSLMPILLRGLDLVDPSIRSHIINTLSNSIDITSADKDAVSMYASTLVLAMLKNCMYMEMPDPGVRAAALKYLALLPGTVRYDLLHPYKTRVLKELAKVLDDPKRVVRKEAVIARCGMIALSNVRLFTMH